MLLTFSIAFWLSLTLLVYVYFGYPLAIIVISKLSFSKHCYLAPVDSEDLPSISVLICAYNEEKSIQRRIENILSNGYPLDKVQVIVASDGSTDRTVPNASCIAFQNLTILDYKENRGRAAVQNDGVQNAQGEIVVFTDAHTEFAFGCLEALTRTLLDESTGCVVGNLTYLGNTTAISNSEGKYFSWEKRIRAAESRLGVLHTCTGACMAVRLALWRELTPIDDCDFTTPLDVILQGFRVVYTPAAVAYDYPSSSPKGELRVRIRQTSKNLAGTLKRWGYRSWFDHPFVGLSLLSHKILRWMSGFFLLALLVSNMFMFKLAWFYQMTLALQICFYMLALVGFLAEVLEKRIPLAALPYAFCVASTGMAVGVIKGLVGRAPAAYNKAD